MGQIFYACAYDTESKNCCVYEADKFHANCYSFSGAVAAMHYLLRKKPYHVMWGGEYVLLSDDLDHYSREEDLLGISTYIDFKMIEENIPDIKEKKYYDKAKLIGENNKLWNKIMVLDDAMEYFDFKNTQSVKYSGYLVNHSQKLAVDLNDYYHHSKGIWNDGDKIITIDPLPVLTETGGGTAMALFNGISNETTEQLIAKWCGDLLQIVDELPGEFKLIECCFAEIWNRADYCHIIYGTDADGYILKNNEGKRYEISRLNVFNERGLPSYIKVEFIEDRIRYIPIDVEETKQEDIN